MLLNLRLHGCDDILESHKYRVEMYPGVICSAVHAATRSAFAITTLHPGSNLKNLAYEEGKKRGSLQLASCPDEVISTTPHPQTPHTCDAIETGRDWPVKPTIHT
jgi:hypothetical protein